MKTLAGLVLQSIPSMAAYMLVTSRSSPSRRRRPASAGRLRILMSLEPDGRIAARASWPGRQNMSARNAMALNTCCASSP